MKVRTDYITNSSSTAFIITNLTNEKKKLIDFVFEVMDDIINYCVFDYNYWFDDNDTESIKKLKTYTKALKSGMEDYDIIWLPNERKYIIFGDSDGTFLGRVFDYMLRDGGQSKSFIWRFGEYLR